MYSKVIIYTILRNEQKTEIESSGDSEGIENVLASVLRESFNAKIFVHRSEARGMEEKHPRQRKQKV